MEASAPRQVACFSCHSTVGRHFTHQKIEIEECATESLPPARGDQSELSNSPGHRPQGIHLSEPRIEPRPNRWSGQLGVSPAAKIHRGSQLLVTLADGPILDVRDHLTSDNQ